MTTSVRQFASSQGINNVFTFSAVKQKMFSDTLKEMSGYETKTTFFSDLSIAEWYGNLSIIDTHKRIIKEWFKNTEMFTEYVMALNHQCWFWYNNGNTQLSKLYSDLYYETRNKVLDNYKGKDLRYFLDITD
jgi:hypothetical protein